MAKQVFIELDGHLVCTLFGDRYEFPGGKHDLMEPGFIPLIGMSPGETEQQGKQRVAQMLKASFPQKVMLSVEYPDAAEAVEPASEAAVEAVPAVEAAPKAKTKPAKKAAKAKK